MKKTELLLPVGTFDMAWAAIQNGADAIYVGFPGFNARGRTADLELSELDHIISTCHLNGVKVNLALNIVIFENELSKVIELLNLVIPLKPDAFIVQDLGIAQLIRKMAPEQVIHASTQMTITNHEAISLLEDLNIKRFVLGRENSIDEIKLIRAKTNKELEVFVHGALCVAYSGQCFTSESLGGRSANRGQCAQSCRFSYELLVDGQKMDLGDKQFLVSPQDLCGLKEIPELINIGVNSFKVEGRLKTADYVATVAHEYRSVIDSVENHQSKTQNELNAAIQNMAVTYSRGFYSGWLHGVEHQKLVDGTFSAHRGALIGHISKIVQNEMRIKLETETELNPGDGLVWSTGAGGKSSEQGAQIFESLRMRPGEYAVRFSNLVTLDPKLAGCPVYINHKSILSKAVQKSMTDRNSFKKIPVTISLKLTLGEKAVATMSDGKNQVICHSISAIEKAKTKGTTDEFIVQELKSLGATVYSATEVKIERLNREELFFSHKEIKELRRDLQMKMDQSRTSSTIDGFRSEVKDLDSVKKWSEEQRIKSNDNLEKSQKPLGLNVLLRDRSQVINLVDAIKNNLLNQNELNWVTLDFEFGRDFLPSLELLKNQGIKAGLATTRVLKPQEYGNLRAIEKMNPDLILIRNLGSLHYFTKTSPFIGDLIGDFSLNVTNHLTAEYLLGKGLKTLSLSYDLNHVQVQDLLQNVDASQMEITMHQYMPSFHMEHCVFAAFLSKGSSFKDCGKPCEKHTVELRDQFGNHHHIKPDQECRNTMYKATPNSAASYLEKWENLGLGQVRFEALNETGPELVNKISYYLDLLHHRKTAAEVTSNLKLIEKYGLGLGNIGRETEYQSRKKSLHTF